ncbi:hypothetical protein DL96DRAFT_1587175 [Flagelloscypha sp. PMI_526]|nr:hypothetical protein DL96DRAFT_1587175 [Flagelloscypha sp. PMI_526]
MSCVGILPGGCIVSPASPSFFGHSITLNVDPIYTWPLQFCLFSTTATWVLSVVTNNVSQVDRVWTFLPTIYTAYFALMHLLPTEQVVWLAPFNPSKDVTEASPRALIMLGVTTIWMFRLSYNTYRRGLFNLKDEDYRWAVLRAQLPPWLFQVVNLSFIAIIQNVLLLSLGYPTKLAAVDQMGAPLESTDYYLVLYELAVLLFEFTADNQQFSYQTFKYDLLAKEAKSQGKKLTVAQVKAEVYDPKKQWPLARLAWTRQDAKRGFVTRGLWAYMRHPNFAAEQSFWWIMSSFPLVASPPPVSPDPFMLIPGLRSAFTGPAELRWTTVGETLSPLVPLLPAFALSMLFFSSTAYTEAITLKKYPKAYKAYQDRVGMFVWSHSRGTMIKLEGREEEVNELVWGDSEKVVVKKED